MMTTFHTVFSIFLLQMYAYGKENATKVITEIPNPTLTALDINNITNAEEEISKSKETTSSITHSNEQTQRQKRDYNFNGYQPFPSIYSSYDFRNNFPVIGSYGQKDPLVQIHEKLSGIAQILRQPTMPPVPPATRYPVFLPFLYLHNGDCRGTSGGNKRPHRVNPSQIKPTTEIIPTKPNPTKPTLPSTDITLVPEFGIASRGPEISDNVNGSFIENGEDFSRPISFDPIVPIEGMRRHPPPVEHGSVQGEISSDNAFISTSAPPSLIGRDTTRYIPGLTTTSLPTPELPTLCDRAIVSCCHQVTVTYNCFATQGCPDPSVYGNPCDTAVILKVIDRLQRFYTKINYIP